MSSNGRSVRVRGEKRQQLDVARFARAVLALHVQRLQAAKAAVEAQAGQTTSEENRTAKVSPPDADEPEAEP